jgi:ribosomal protein L37AE/L43A
VGPRTPPVDAVTCPFCSSAEVERVAQWGGQIITAQWKCGACNSYFEAVRDDFDDPSAAAEAAAPEFRD